MTIDFKFEIYAGPRITDPAVFERLWAMLDDPFVQPTRYDAVERARQEFVPDPEPARRLLANGSLFVKGKRDRFTLFVERVRGLSMCSVYLHYRSWNAEWMTWFERLCRELPILFGYAATDAEHDRKHETERLVPDGLGTITGTIGNTVDDFYRFLPGIYWTTFFGKALDSLDFAAAGKLEGVSVRDLGDGKHAVQLAGSPETDDLDARLTHEQRIADALGDDYFFDRSRPDRALRQVPGLEAELARMARR